jgi:DNA adenine methylase
MRPLLKWAGGKSRLAPEIDAAFPVPIEGRWIEPFLGSGAVFLHMAAQGRIRSALVADANARLVAMHQAVRNDVEAVIAAMSRLPVGTDWAVHYDALRDAYNAGPQSGATHAARFLWLNRACYNGLYRENRSGRFNVPCGSYASLALPSADHIRAVSALLQRAELRVDDFGAVLREAGAGDAVYCDPPYVPLTETASFTGYHASPFGPAEQRRLALSARRAAFCGATVVLSNHDLPVVSNDLYAPRHGFEHVARPRVARAISRSAATRAAVGEILARIGPRREVA